MNAQNESSGTRPATPRTSPPCGIEGGDARGAEERLHWRLAVLGKPRSQAVVSAVVEICRFDDRKAEILLLGDYPLLGVALGDIGPERSL